MITASHMRDLAELALGAAALLVAVYVTFGAMLPH